jgi:hypothetical protein
LLATSSGDGGWEERRRGVAYIGEGSKGGPGFGSRDLTRLEFLVGAAGRGPLVGSLVSVATRQRVEAGMDRARLDGIDSVVSSCESVMSAAYWPVAAEPSTPPPRRVHRPVDVALLRGYFFSRGLKFRSCHHILNTNLEY